MHRFSSKDYSPTSHAKTSNPSPIATNETDRHSNDSSDKLTGITRYFSNVLPNKLAKKSAKMMVFSFSIRAASKKTAKCQQEWVAGDDELGRSSPFRRALRKRKVKYVLAVPCNTTVRDLGNVPKYSGGGLFPPSEGCLWFSGL